MQKVAAAVAIDAENIGACFAERVCRVVLRRRAEETLVDQFAIGHLQHMVSWERVCQKHQIRREIMESHEKNATDGRIQEEKWRLFHRGVHCLYLVSGDGDYCACVKALRTQGCVVRGVGVRGITSPELMEACTTYAFV